MPIPFATDVWMKAVRLELSRSPAFREAARNWRSDFYFVIRAGPGVPRDVYLYLEVRYGECSQADRVDDPAHRSPDLIIEGAIDVWRQVFQKERDLLQTLMKRDLAIRSGQLVQIMGYPKAAQALVNGIARVDTEWPATVA